jgi:hypothetical protein
MVRKNDCQQLGDKKQDKGFKKVKSADGAKDIQVLNLNTGI